MKLEALPKGFRFRPTDEELVSHYLRLKINGHHSAVKVIPEIDVCKWEPWDLPALSVIKSDDPEWFFFCPRDRKYPNGHRSNRATEAGYWKATGKDRTIKSRNSLPSGHVNGNIIGTKKTLVFYKGRAPKGERMNWIMHEYRATEPDLDGTAPGQGDYVLCRLFHKADVKLDDSKCDDVEPTGSSLSTNKSSPDDVSSDLLLDPAVLALHIHNEVDAVKWKDEEDRMGPIQVPIESSASDGVHNSNKEEATKGRVLSREDIGSDEVECNQFNYMVSDPLQSRNYNDPEACIGSPYADDFGNDHNGFHFQDGTSEQDVSLSKLLEFFQNNDSYLNEESGSHENSVSTRETLIPGHTDGLHKTCSASCNVNDGKRDGETKKTILHSQRVANSQDFLGHPSADGPLCHNADKEYDASADKVQESCHKSDDSFCRSYPVKSSSSHVGQNRINIRSRHPRNQSNVTNSAGQGDASRRIRLWSKLDANSICDEKSKAGWSWEEQESQSTFTEASQDSTTTIKSQESLQARLLDEKVRILQSCYNPRLGLPVKLVDEKDSAKLASVMFSKPNSADPGAIYLKSYAVRFYLVIILSVVVMRFWKCPSWNALHC